MGTKRTKSHALVQAHLNEEDYIKLEFIRKAEGIDMTNTIRKLIRDQYAVLTDGIDPETVAAYTDLVKGSIINSVKGEKEMAQCDVTEKKTYEPKTDCFAYRENSLNKSKRECMCLTEMVCMNKGKCSFYKKKGV